MRIPRWLPVVLFGVAIALLWTIVEVVAPAAIRSAHSGRGPLALRNALSGRDVHPASHYVAVWRHRARPAAVAVTVVGLVAATLSSVAVRRRIARALAPRAGSPAASLPPPGRRAAVTCLALGFAGGSLIELAIDPPYRGEHWPFSQYRMCSETPRRSPLVGRRLFGVTAEDPAREIPLQGAYIRPFDGPRLAISFDRLDQAPDRERLLTAALADCLRRYELRRARGAHAGPRLEALRLYRLTWNVDDRASTRDSPGKELIWEVQASNPPTRSR